MKLFQFFLNKIYIINQNLILKIKVSKNSLKYLILKNVSWSISLNRDFFEKYFIHRYLALTDRAFVYTEMPTTFSFYINHNEITI